MTRLPRLALTLAVLLAFGAVAAGCGGDDDNPSSPNGGSTPADVVITIPSGSITAGAAAFTPNPATVKLGQTVSWKNNDNMTHNAVGSGFSVSVGAGGTSTPVTITGSTGNRAYTCTLAGHVMTGTLTVEP